MNANNTTVCTMPEHGLATATAPCCRPGSPEFRGPPPATPQSLALALPDFWRDRIAWGKAARNTLNCLIGCSIGDFAVLIYMHIYHPHAPMWLTMGLAMTAGLITSLLSESAMLRFKEGFPWKSAVSMAFSMSFLSMLGMELVANMTDFMLTGGKVPVSDPFYWVALALALAAGFMAPLPYNYYQFKKHGRACH